MSDTSPTPGLEPAGQAPNIADGKAAAEQGIDATPPAALEPAGQAPGVAADPSAP